MKKWLSFLLLIVSINGFSQLSPVSSSANDDLTSTVNVILSITHNDKNIIDPVKNLLNSMNGVSILAYCDGHAVFMLSLNKNIFRDANDFKVLLYKNYSKSEDLISFKDGDFMEFSKYCQPSDPKEADNLKKLVTN